MVVLPNDNFSKLVVLICLFKYSWFGLFSIDFLRPICLLYIFASDQMFAHGSRVIYKDGPLVLLV